MDKGQKMTDAMISDEANDVIDEAVKHAVTQSAMTIVYEVVQGMLKTDPTVSALKEVIKHDLDKVINTRVEALIKERANKSNEDTLSKTALQTELEMVSFVLPLCDCFTADLRLGEETLRHQSRHREEPRGLP
jgi:hypothetical protein